MAFRQHHFLVFRPKTQLPKVNTNNYQKLKEFSMNLGIVIFKIKYYGRTIVFNICILGLFKRH